MEKNVISCVSYQEGNELWCYDEVAGILSRTDLNDWKTEVMASPRQIVREQSYKVRKLIGWGDEILMLPVQNNRKWAVYHKSDKTVAFETFCREPYESAEAVLKGDHLTLLPLSPAGFVVVTDLRQRKTVKKIPVRSHDFVPKDGMEIWEAKMGQDDICFLIRGSRFYGRLQDGNLRLIELQASGPFMCADFVGDTVWAYQDQGSCLCRFGREGNLLDSYPIETGKTPVRILAQADHIVLLPEEGSTIGIFDVKTGKVRTIGGDGSGLLPILPEAFHVPSYWDHGTDGDLLWLLPLRYPMVKVNLETLEWSQHRLEYGDDCPEGRYWEWCQWLRESRDRSYYHEDPVTGLKGYLEFVKMGSAVKAKEQAPCGANIWKSLKEG